MGKPAARITDMHVCPMVTPGLPPIPHVGGPIIGPGCPTVLIGGLPAAVMGDMCTCVGPPDTIVLGSTGVMIGGKPAARMGDQCAHGGTIVLGCPTVMIGEISPGPPVVIGMAVNMVSGNAIGSPPSKAKIISSMFEKCGPLATAPFSTKVARIHALTQGAEEGAETVHKHDENDCKMQFEITGPSGEPAKGQKYEIRTTDGNTFSGNTDDKGLTKKISGYSEGDCTISFE